MLNRKRLGTLKILGDRYCLSKANLEEITGRIGEVFSMPGYGFIDIDEKLPDESSAYKETLLHEVLHALSNILGLNLSEEQTEGLGVGLERTLSENPGFLAMSKPGYDYMIIKLWKEGNSLRETGRRLGISKDTVQRALKCHGFETVRQQNETVRRENKTGDTSFETSQKVRGNVGVQLIFWTLLLILIGCLIYIIYCHFEKKRRDRQASENPKEKKTFGFEGKSVEDLQESTGFELPFEELPDNPF